MKIVENNYDKEIVLAMGLFDSVHRGHAHLIAEAKEIAGSEGVELAVFTFKNNPFRFYNRDTKMVFTFSERLRIFEELGVDVVIGKNMDADYAKTTKEDFISGIFNSFKIKAVVCGADYTFGAGGNGNVDYLKKRAEEAGISLTVVPYFRTDNGDKISSNLIRKCLSDGQIRRANQLMGRPYMISGDVVHCFGRGREFGFPTTNLFVPEEKATLREGVYATGVEVDGYTYDAITNIGSKPTFDDYSFTVESFLIDYKGNLYGKFITVYFYGKIRDTRKFASENEIRARIEQYIEVAALIKRTL